MIYQKRKVEPPYTVAIQYIPGNPGNVKECLNFVGIKQELPVHLGTSSWYIITPEKETLVIKPFCFIIKTESVYKIQSEQEFKENHVMPGELLAMSENKDTYCVSVSSNHYPNTTTMNNDKS